MFAIVALGVGLVALALPDRDAGKLEEEGARLGSLLEMARAEARVAGVPVRWVPHAEGQLGAAEDTARADFNFVGLPRSLQLPNRWLDERTSVQITGAPFVVLGPEAILPPQRLVLRLGEQQLTLVSDGLGPFEQAMAPTADTGRPGAAGQP